MSDQWRKALDAGIKAFDQKKFELAESKLIEAVQLTQPFGARDPRLGISLDRLGRLKLAMNDPESAETHLKRSLSVFEVSLGLNTPEVAGALRRLGDVAIAMNRFADGVDYYQRALDTHTNLPTPVAEEVRAISKWLIEFYEKHGGPADVDRVRLAAMSALTRDPQTDPGEILDNFKRLARSAQLRGAQDDLINAYQGALNLIFDMNDPDPVDTLAILEALARLRNQRGEAHLARPIVAQAVSICDALMDPNDPSLAKRLTQLADLYMGHIDAEPPLRRAIAILAAAFGPDSPNLLYPMNRLAEVLLRAERFAEAEPLFVRYLNMRTRELGPGHLDLVPAALNLAQTLTGLGRHVEAENHYRQILASQVKAFGPESPDLIPTLEKLAIVSRKQGRLADAVTAFQRAVALAERRLGPNHPATASALGNYAITLRLMGRDAEAAQLESRALRNAPTNTDGDVWA